MPSIEILKDGDVYSPLTPPGAPAFIIPRLRDPKVDVAVTLGIALGAVGMTNNFDGTTGMSENRMLTIVKNGTFHQDLIRDKEYVGRSVINVAIGGQTTIRGGIGPASGGLFTPDQLTDPFKPDPNRPSPTVAELASMKYKRKETSVELDIFDINLGVADALKDLVIALMDHSVEDVMCNQLNYIECIETSYSETTGVDQASGDPIFIYQRSLDYRAVWASVAFKQPTLADLVQQTLTLLTATGHTTEESITTDV